MKFLAPTEADLLEARRSIGTFDGAIGSFGFDGAFEPDPIFPMRLWIMTEASTHQVETLWEMASLPTKGSAYPDVMAYEQKFFRLEFFKVRKNWFSTRWAGNLWIWAGPNLQIEVRTSVGSVGGDAQADMWAHFRLVILGKETLFKTTVQAITER